MDNNIYMEAISHLPCDKENCWCKKYIDTPTELFIKYPIDVEQETKRELDCLDKTPQLNTPFSSCLFPVSKNWGYYVDLFRTEDVVAKRLVIYPGHRFSHQYHNNRDEVWMITTGKGSLWLNDEIKIVEPGFNVFIKRGDKHRLANIGNENLVFFEIQYGNCSEEDIVRLSDDYGRS